MLAGGAGRKEKARDINRTKRFHRRSDFGCKSAHLEVGAGELECLESAREISSEQ
jgi:hypothetical protein